MRHISIEPPPFFHRGPSPLTRLAFFGLLSLALLFADTRYRYLENLRQAVAVALYIGYYRNSLRKFRTMSTPRATFRADESSFTMTSDAGTTTRHAA